MSREKHKLQKKASVKQLSSVKQTRKCKACLKQTACAKMLSRMSLERNDKLKKRVKQMCKGIKAVKKR